MLRSFVSNENLSEVVSSSRKLPFVFIGVLGLLLAALLYLGIYLEYGPFVLAFLFAIPAALIAIRYPRVWLYSIAVICSYFFAGREEGLSGIDVVLGAAIFGSLFSWFFWILVIKKENLIKNLADVMISLFFILLIANFFVALINNVDPLDWIRETIIVSIVLYYFPFRYYLKEKKEINTILVMFALATLVVALLQLNEYRKAMSDVVYAYQLLKSVKQNQTLFVAATSVGIAFFLYHRKITLKIATLLFSGIALISLISTMSRTFWIILLFNLILIFFMVSQKDKLKMVLLTLTFSIIAISTVFIVFGDKADIMITLLENRLSSSTQGVKDPSVLARVYEYDEMLSRIADNPIGGYGMNASIRFFNPIEQETQTTSINHNGFFFLFFRVGIPMALLYILPLLYWTYRSFRYSIVIKDPYYKNLTIAFFSCLMLIIIANFPSTQLDTRDAVFVTALAYAIIANVIEKYESKRIT